VKSPGRIPPVGEIRQSQIITTYGPGSMLDLPDDSVIVGGLDFWRHHDRFPVFEDRLLASVRRILGDAIEGMYAPPIMDDTHGAPRSGVDVFRFPNWFVAQLEEKRGAFRTRPLVHRKNLVPGMKFEDRDGKKHDVVPVRFIQACVNGHISDIDWRQYAHSDVHPDCRGDLWLDEGGTSGDIADIHVRCEKCGARRPLVSATVTSARVLGTCRGDRPWLGEGSRESCDQPNRLLIRHASNAYFPQILSVISIPDKNEGLQKAVNDLWKTYLETATGPEFISTIRVIPVVKSTLGELRFKDGRMTLRQSREV
jgi:hypothetical protein